MQMSAVHHHAGDSPDTPCFLLGLWIEACESVLFFQVDCCGILVVSIGETLEVHQAIQGALLDRSILVWDQRRSGGYLNLASFNANALLRGHFRGQRYRSLAIADW